MMLILSNCATTKYDLLSCDKHSCSTLYIFNDEARCNDFQTNLHYLDVLQDEITSKVMDCIKE
jgi:hypothetical protein